MAVYRLGAHLAFPPPEEAEPSGLLAVGGDLRPERLLLAYSMGIFPWPLVESPLLWFSPDPRMALRPSELHVSRSLRKTLRRRRYEVRLDTAFAEVVRRCADVPRCGGPGTWITPALAAAYEHLHGAGFAHSAEAWEDGILVGGLYGVSLGGAFFGESMFAERTDASKVAFVTLVRQLGAWGFDLVDCQVHTEHLARFGAREWPRTRFLAALAKSLEKPTRAGAWRLDAAAGSCGPCASGAVGAA
jgi:leucyl/phenylalanyl-tRNA--protein transferase